MVFYFVVGKEQYHSMKLYEVMWERLILLLLSLLHVTAFHDMMRAKAKNWIGGAVAISALTLGNPTTVQAGMLTFPLKYPLKNNIVVVRAGESIADSNGIIETAPIKKLRQDNALTPKGRMQVVETAKQLRENFQPSYVWTSNTERAYETAALIASELDIGQNRIVPEYSFLDARAMGLYEGTSLENYQLVDEADRSDINYRPPASKDGTPSDSISDVLVRMNQLVSTIESLYSGENVVIISPDSEILSVLLAAIHDDNPDDTIPLHDRFGFKNAEFRVLNPFIHPPETIASGQTQEEANDNARKFKASLVTRNRDGLKMNSWMQIWDLSND